MEEQASINAHQIILQAYRHPTEAAHRFRHVSECPHCSCEFVTVLKEEPGVRIYSCQGCFTLFRTERRAA